MSVGQFLLTVRGQDDRWLSMNPDRTYFEGKYQSRINRSRETYEIPFDNIVTFGSTGRCTIPPKGDYMTRLTLRMVLPPIYLTVPGQYVFPTPSSNVGATVYVNKTLTNVNASGGTLTANTSGNHYFSTGTQVTLSGTTSLNGTYTIASIPTSNSFTCSTALTGTSATGTVSTPGIQCADIVSYFSTTNSNLWVNNLTNKTWQITSGSNTGSTVTFTTATPSNIPVGSQVVLNLTNASYLSNRTFTVTASTETTFTCAINGNFVTGNDKFGTGIQTYSTDNGATWSSVASPISATSWAGLASGSNVFVMVGYNTYARSVNNGLTWTANTTPLIGNWYAVAYGNGVFVMLENNGSRQAYSTDAGLTWTYVPAPSTVSGYWLDAAFGNGVFVAISGTTFPIIMGDQARSTDNGLTWSYASTRLTTAAWNSVAFGNGVFVTVGWSGKQARSTDNGQNWSFASTQLAGNWFGVAFGNGVFVMVGGSGAASSSTVGRSTDNGQTWTSVSLSISDTAWGSIAFANNTFVIIGTSSRAYSLDNGLTWQSATGYIPTENNYQNISRVTYGNFAYTRSPSDSVSLVTPPLQLLNRAFSSSAYSSISFANAADAAFWGFDSREGLTYTLPATPPWTYTQSGWIAGFLPPSTSTYYDSVAHKLCKSIRLLVGKQTIKEYTGEYIELQNDLFVPYENKAILKLMNGTLDQTQSTVSREYYVNLPLGTKEVPLCALTHQNMSVEIDFDSYTNSSQNLNQGTGAFTDVKSYTTYDISKIKGGAPIYIQSSFSYQQYVLISLYTNNEFIIFDTTKSPSSYILVSLGGGGGGSKFCVLSGYLYIGVPASPGYIASIRLSELVQGNTSSYVAGSTFMGIGIVLGSLVADFRYVYYGFSGNSTINLIRYDTTAPITSSSSYTVVDFKNTFNTSISDITQILTTGTQLILFPQGTPGKLYTYQLNANVQTQWYALDYSSYGYQISEGVLVGNSVYFMCDNFVILKYTNSTFTSFSVCADVFLTLTSTGQLAYSTTNGVNWYAGTTTLTGTNYWYSAATGNGIIVAVGNNVQQRSIDNGRTWSSATTQLSGLWYNVTFGNGIFVMVGNYQAYSTNNGLTWNRATTQVTNFTPFGVAFGNNTFVAVGLTGAANTGQAYSSDNGLTWNTAITAVSGNWQSVAFGNGVFVTIGSNIQARSTDNGLNWASVASPLSGTWTSVAFGNGVFVMVGTNVQARSTNNGQTWTSVASPLSGSWTSVTFLSGVFVMVGINVQAYSTNNGQTWTSVASPVSGSWNFVVASPKTVSISGSSLSNLYAVGNYIYATTNNVAVQIDTTKDLLTSGAYSFPDPLTPGTFGPFTKYAFASGPRYLYMFTRGFTYSTTKIYTYDPYTQSPTFKASILVDYESLPDGTKKPDKALLGLVQTQKVTDMNYMNIKGPVKEVWITGTSNVTNVFQYSNLATQSTLNFNGEGIITNDVGTRTFLNTIQPFETHTAMPIRNFSVVPFEFDPENAVPNGTVNFSRIRDQILTANAATVWVRNYNLLSIQGGIGGLIFNS